MVKSRANWGLLKTREHCSLPPVGEKKKKRRKKSHRPLAKKKKKFDRGFSIRTASPFAKGTTVHIRRDNNRGEED